MIKFNGRALVRVLLGLAWTPLGIAAVDAQTVSVYRQMCDASAAVALDAEHFIVGDNARNTLRIYKRGRSDQVAAIDLSKFLGTKPDRESDLEGAAVLGDRIYWISSHARNSRGNVQPSRRRFFATQVRSGPSGPTVVPIGKPSVKLLVEIRAAPQLAPYKLREAGKLKPEAEGGFNIEGLAATPDGKLLIGLRNPIPNNRALIIPLLNPAAIIEGKKTELGAPITLDLDGRGIRSIDLVGSTYLVIGGPPANTGSFALYRWSGASDDKPTQIQGIDFKDLRPEGLFAIPGTSNVQIISGDGDVLVEGKPCKEQPEAKRLFRSVIVTP